jgi:hypothetical protein
MKIYQSKKPKHPKKKKEGPTSKKTKESLERANHGENIKFLNPLLLRETY